MLQRVVRLLSTVVSPLVVVAAPEQALPELPAAVTIMLVPEFVLRMVDLLGNHDISVVEIDGFAHPLSAVYRRHTLPHIEALLARDRLRPAFLFETVRTRRVQREELESVDPELSTLRNLNTPEDYLNALKAAGLHMPP
jgi:molybdopterin-guanine dinucleotide biosynthesis protein A